jgi:hypothetical protein
MKLKASYHAGNAAYQKQAKAGARAIAAFDAKQQGKQHQGRSMTPITGTKVKSQPKSATGGYVGGNPFKGLKT